MGNPATTPTPISGPSKSASTLSTGSFSEIKTYLVGLENWVKTEFSKAVTAVAPVAQAVATDAKEAATTVATTVETEAPKVASTVESGASSIWHDITSYVTQIEHKLFGGSPTGATTTGAATPEEVANRLSIIAKH